MSNVMQSGKLNRGSPSAANEGGRVKETRKQDVEEKGKAHVKLARPENTPKKWTAHYSDESREEEVKQNSSWTGLVALGMVCLTILGIVWIVFA
jgi:hypothetical protein